MTIVVPGKFIQQVNPEIVEIETRIGERIEEEGGEQALKKTVGYGFCSDELWELAGIMFKTLSLDDQHKMVEIRHMDHFPYLVNGECDCSSS